MGMFDGSESKLRVVPIAYVAALALLGVAIVAVTLAFVASLSAAPIGAGDSGTVIYAGQVANGTEYVLPESNTRLYSQEELGSLSSWDLYVAINEIYARHGRGFSNDDLAEHFSSCSWYLQLYSPEEFDAMPSPLNEFEQGNSDAMAKIRNERGD